jgi:F-type H+-transporting ATPase subunit gamma
VPQLNLRDLRRKIRSIENLKKITRAMQMVSASKLKKTQGRLMQIRPYADKISEMLANVSRRIGKVEHPLLTPRAEVKSALVLVITSDKGLCGTYNTNLINHAEKFIRELGKPCRIVSIGKKAETYFAKRKVEVVDRFTSIPADVPFHVTQKIAEVLLREFDAGRADEVYISFTKFVNALTFRPNTVKFIPVQPAAGKEKKNVESEYLYEPQPRQILNRLVPRYLETSLQRLVLESLSSEHAARMNAMRNATDNAKELIESLTLTRNKLRQANITKELLDIVTGAEALKGK